MLTQELPGKLAAADRAHQSQLGLEFLLRVAKYAGPALLALFALDVALHLGAGWRLGLTLGLLVAAASVAGWTFYVGRVRRNSPEKTARLLESRDAALGSKLINFLQLHRALDGQSALTRQLGEQALNDYSARLAGVDFRPLTRAPDLRRHRRRALIVLGLSAVALAACYPISRLEFLRFADPFGDHPPFALTRLEITEPADGTTVVYNQGIVVKAHAGGHQPDELYLSFYDPARPADVHTVPMFGKGELGFLQEIEGVKSDLVIYAHTKNGRNVSPQRRLTVGLTPQVDAAFVTVAPPAYTGIKPVETTFNFKEVKALAGSEVRFRLRSNRPLSGGSIDLQTENAPAAPVALQPGADNEVSGGFTAAGSGRLRFAVTDVAHNVSQQNLSANLVVTHDLPPEISIETPPDDSFVCEDFKVEARIAATDDYGLRTIRIHRALNDVFSPPREIGFDRITTSTTEKLEFDIKDLGVQPGDVISFFAEAVDTCPDPHLSRSKTVHLMVISTEEYNNFIRERADISDIQEKYSDLLNDFHDLVDEQKAVGDRIRDIQDKIAKGESDPKNLQPELDKLVARQAEINQKLGAMADKMDHFVRDKPAYDLESDLQQTLTQKASEIRQSLAQNNDALKKTADAMAASGTHPSPGSNVDALQSLQEQSDQQLARLDQTRRTAEEQIMPPLEDASLMNTIVSDMNRFKELYDAQQAAAEQTRTMQNKTDLTEADKLALKQLAGTEREMGAALQQLASDLREHADAAQEKFPKAAASARDLAAAVGSGQLTTLAKRASASMLAGDGPGSFNSAEALRSIMGSLFKETQQGQPGRQAELDQYLQLQRGRRAGNTFEQMSRSRKAGFGRGRGQGQGGSGQGQNGEGGDALDGYSVGATENFGVLGGENLGGGTPGHPSANGGRGKGKAAGPGQKSDADRADAPGSANATNRNTDGIRTENPMEDYRDAIDAYFNTITR